MPSSHHTAASAERLPAPAQPRTDPFPADQIMPLPNQYIPQRMMMLPHQYEPMPALYMHQYPPSMQPGFPGYPSYQLPFPGVPNQAPFYQPGPQQHFSEGQSQQSAESNQIAAAPPPPASTPVVSTAMFSAAPTRPSLNVEKRPEAAGEADASRPGTAQTFMSMDSMGPVWRLLDSPSALSPMPEDDSVALKGQAVPLASRPPPRAREEVVARIPKVPQRRPRNYNDTDDFRSD
jgi:hypothetical protein